MKARLPKSDPARPIITCLLLRALSAPLFPSNCLFWGVGRGKKGGTQGILSPPLFIFSNPLLRRRRTISCAVPFHSSKQIHRGGRHTRSPFFLPHRNPRVTYFSNNSSAEITPSLGLSFLGEKQLGLEVEGGGSLKTSLFQMLQSHPPA